MDLSEGGLGGFVTQQQRCLWEEGFDGQGFTPCARQRLEEDRSWIISLRRFVAGLIAGLVLASRYGERVADWLSSFITNNTVAQVLGFVFVLIAVSAAVSLLATLLRRFVGLLFLGWLDHLLGGVLGLVQGMLLCTIILIVVAVFPTELFTNALADSRIALQLVRVIGSVVLIFLPASNAWFRVRGRQPLRLGA